MTQEQYLIRQLRNIRARILALFALNGVGRLMMILPAAILVAVLLDYFLPGHFPGFLRAVMLLALLGITGVLIVVHLWRPLRTKITIDDVALELEGQFPELDDRLATTVNFIQPGQRGGESETLRRAVVDQTMQSVQSIKLTSSMRPWPLVGIFLAGLLVTLVIGSLAVVYGNEAGIGLERLFNPFTERQWPKKTHLDLRSKDAVIPIGQDHDIIVGLDEGSDRPSRVVLHHREIDSDTWEHEVMDDRQAENGEPYFVHSFPRVRAGFEFYVTGGDDRRPAEGHYTVDARPRPYVENIILTITPPAYVTGVTPVPIPGEGSTSALQGSTIRMDVLTNKPIGADDKGQARAEVLLGDDANQVRIRMQFVAPAETLPENPSEAIVRLEQRKVERTYLRAEFELKDSTPFDFEMVCTDGFKSQLAESRHYLEATPDKAPRVVLEEPTQAIMDVTPRSAVELDVFSEDDYGLTKSAFGFRRGEQGTPVYQGLEVYDVAKGTADRPLQIYSRRRWDLREIEPELTEGEELVYWAAAEDNFTWNDNKPHRSASQEYRLRVISVQDKKDDLARRLPALAMRVQDLVERQERLQGETKETRAEKKPQELLNAQGREQVIEQEGTQRELTKTAEALRDDFESFLDEWRIHRVPQDEAFELGKALEEALDEVAKDPMPKAADELRTSRDAQAAAKDQSEGLNNAVDQMQRVIDRLRGALSQLDRFNEAEQLSQEFKDLLNRQKKLTEETRDHAAKTLGKQESELSDAEREQQDALERRQRELSAETKEAIRKIRESAERLAESDPAVSQALQEAHEEAENRDPGRKMDRASKDIAETQAASAKPSQEAAEQDLEQIIEKLQDRYEAELQDRIKQLEALKKEVQALKAREQGHLQDNKGAQEKGQQTQQADRLSKEQQRTQQDTQKLSEKMEQAEAGPAQQSTQQASQSMQQASQQLSQSQNQEAQEDQEEAIEKLGEAEEQLEDEIEQAKEELAQEQLEKMKEKLARIKDAEVQVNEATVDLQKKKEGGDGRLARSDRGRLVTNQDIQKELLNETGDILGQLEDAGVKVFHYALTIVADRMAESHERLLENETDRITQSAQERAIEILGQLVDALEEEIAQRKKDQQQGGGGGGGGGGEPELVPSLAELKMLRLMQKEVNQNTEQVGQEIQKDEGATPETEAETKRLGRDQDRLKRLMESLTDPSAGGAGGEQI